jgi:hypothetical protein
LQELRVEQEWAANQVYFEEYRQKEEKRTQEEVRPDFAVCCASVTVRRDYFAASQKLREQQGKGCSMGSEPDFAVEAWVRKKKR